MKESRTNTDWVSDAPTPAQLKEFFAQMERGKITKERLQAFLRGGVEISDMLRDWEKFYLETFGIKVDLSGLNVPPHKKGFDRLIVVILGITPQKIYDKCKDLFPCWKWTDKSLDEIVTSDRTAKDGTYAVWFKDVVEADEKLKNLSANDLKKKEISGITLEERLLYELKLFQETEEHLDISSWTLCAGSRYDDGYAPLVDWYLGELEVDWDVSDSRYDHLRSRQAVS